MLFLPTQTTILLTFRNVQNTKQDRLMVFISSHRLITYDVKFPAHLPRLPKTISTADADDNKLCCQATDQQSVKYFYCLV
jgi:hypothetical protein